MLRHVYRGGSINFAYMAPFSTSRTCHMWRISDFSTSVMWRHLKFLRMWRNFQFPHNCHTWKAKISQHDNFFSTNNVSDINDKYEVCVSYIDGSTVVLCAIQNIKDLLGRNCIILTFFAYQTCGSQPYNLTWWIPK